MISLNRKNVIIDDMEDIKETHPDSYELLSGQNIHRLVVAPFRYKDEISGFLAWIIRLIPIVWGSRCFWI